MSVDYIPPAEAFYSHVHWMDELDMLGSNNSLEAYQAHLAKAPLPMNYDTGFLADVIAAGRMVRSQRRRSPP